MSDDLISKQEVLNKLNELDQQELYLPCHFKECVIDEVSNIPQKTGRWKEILVHRDDEGDILRDYECTNCLGIICDVPDDDEKELPRFCCMCGAKMEGYE